MRSDTVVKQNEFDIFKEKLDIVELERFIVLINRKKLDYTKWRKSLFEDMSIDELAEEADKYSYEIFLPVAQMKLFRR